MNFSYIEKILINNFFYDIIFSVLNFIFEQHRDDTDVFSRKINGKMGV